MEKESNTVFFFSIDLSRPQDIGNPMTIPTPTLMRFGNFNSEAFLLHLFFMDNIELIVSSFITMMTEYAIDYRTLETSRRFRSGSLK